MFPRYAFVFTCLLSLALLVLLHGPSQGQQGGFQAVPMRIPVGRSNGVVAERGVALADLTGKGSDDIVLTNGEAGTITLLLSHRGR